MKKKLFKNLCAICIALTSMTSCVQGDFYEMYEEDDLSSQLFISRNKSSKDGMNLMSILGSGSYPVHVISNFQNTGCLMRCLNSLGCDWVSGACDAISTTIEEYSTSSEEKLRKKAKDLERFCDNGTVNSSSVSSCFDDFWVFFNNYQSMGLQQTSSPSSGNMVVFKPFSTWGGPYGMFHAAIISSFSNGGTMFVDTDGNQWSTEFIGSSYAKQ